jgi:hypothetical protein
MYGYTRGTPGVLVISSVVAADLAALGWTKQKVREFLWTHSRIPRADLQVAGAIAWMDNLELEIPPDAKQLDPWPIAAKPENIGLVVAGGAHPSHALWLQGYSPRVVGREICLPENFDQLIAEAEQSSAPNMKT